MAPAFKKTRIIPHLHILVSYIANAGMYNWAILYIIHLDMNLVAMLGMRVSEGLSIPITTMELLVEYLPTLIQKNNHISIIRSDGCVLGYHQQWLKQKLISCALVQ